jgi:mannose-6-phosphate isomerase-like protein (cupin superfamily)
MEGIVIRPGEGEPITALEDRKIAIAVDLEQLCATESWYGSAQPGASTHVHRRHADTFFVVDGELLFTVGSEQVSALAGTTVCVPPGIVHGFESSREARYLNFHTPDRGFAESLRIRRDGHPYDPAQSDSFDPPPDGGLPADAAIVLGSCEGERLARDDRQLLIKVARDELALVEYTLEPGFEGPKPHVHKQHVDAFFVLEGELELRVGDETLTLGAGGCVAAPPETVHTFGHPGPQGARLINVHAPSFGFHEYLRAVDELEGEPDDSFRKRFDVFQVE